MSSIHISRGLANLLNHHDQKYCKAYKYLSDYVSLQCVHFVFRFHILPRKCMVLTQYTAQTESENIVFLLFLLTRCFLSIVVGTWHG